MLFDTNSVITLSQAMSYLVHPRFGRNFYAMTLAPLLRLERKDIPAMAVGAINKRFALFYNTQWINENPFEYVVGVLEHEALHLVLEHLSRGLRFRTALTGDELAFFSTTLDQYAADMAVNSLLIKSNEWMKDNKFDSMITPSAYGLPMDKSYEWYARQLLKMVKKDPDLKKQLADGLTPDGQHGKWSAAHAAWEQMCAGMSDGEKEALANELDRQARTILKKTSRDYQKTCGSVPAHLASIIEELLAPPRIAWERLLRRAVVSTKKYKWVRSTARPNRRHLGIAKLSNFPGRVKDRIFHVVFVVDTSGSMGTPELALAFNELQHLQKVDSDIKITIIEADVGVHKVYTIGFNSTIDPEFHGRGGTSFDLALEEAQKHKPDIALYYTDGYASPPRPPSRVSCPFFWLLTPNGQIPDNNWGRVLRMEDKVCE